VTTSGIHRIDSNEGVIEEVYTARYWPGDSLGDHLEFALKYDGTNFAILGILFQKAGEEELLEYVRRLWFLYEFLTGRLISSFVSASKTTAGSQHGNARATSISCRMKKSLRSNRLFCPLTEAKPNLS
jgi:hypothetical protein